MNTLEKRHYGRGLKRTVSIRLPAQLIGALKKEATKRGHSFSQFINEGLDQWAFAHEKEQK